MKKPSAPARFDATDTTADFRGLSWVFTRPVYAVATLLGFSLVAFACATAGGPGRTIGWIFCALGLAVFLLPTRIHVGKDGIALRWLWVKRLISYQEIEGIGSYDEHQWGRWREIGLRIEFTSGALYLPMKYHDRLLSLLTPDPMRATEAALTSILFHRDNAVTEVAAAALGARVATQGGEDEPSVTEPASDTEQRAEPPSRRDP